MQLQLNGKTALVTGSSRGIGLAIAQTLHEEGCQVVLNARSLDDLNSAASGLPGAISVAGDMTHPDEAQRVLSEAVAHLGHLDILVCNVGGGALRSSWSGKCSRVAAGIRSEFVECH